MKGINQNCKDTLHNAIQIVKLIKYQAKTRDILQCYVNKWEVIITVTSSLYSTRGKVLSRLFKLHDEVRLLLSQLQDEGKPKVNLFLEHCLNDEIWLIKLAYSADTAGSLNILNLTLLGSDVNTFLSKAELRVQ